jgi:hypothetical protein
MDLDKIIALVEAATPGPWKYSDSRDDYWVVLSPGLFICNMNHRNAKETENAEFIAWTREGVPSLVAEIRRLRALLGEK